MIHPTALIDPSAELDSSVAVGPYSVIGPDVRIGKDSVIESHVVIKAPLLLASGIIFSSFRRWVRQPDLKYAGEPTTLTIGNDNVIQKAQPSTEAQSRIAVILNRRSQPHHVLRAHRPRQCDW